MAHVFPPWRAAFPHRFPVLLETPVQRGASPKGVVIVSTVPLAPASPCDDGGTFLGGLCFLAGALLLPAGARRNGAPVGPEPRG
jgi:hypothetical protein